ncbi:hypothetical protein [Phyllobacterium sp. A18/5-2]|uniref:hypothetical protein n=1 Tax=Phyllobacterium sp. A18/5-2 TaxID=2978392 RepID=UPI0029056C2A|nr:hypothetical protein [Phyllobacterium sp. A18/5-2]
MPRIFGREHAVAAITSQLSKGRLITIVGPGCLPIVCRGFDSQKYRRSKVATRLPAIKCCYCHGDKQNSRNYVKSDFHIKVLCFDQSSLNKKSAALLRRFGSIPC